MNQVIVGKIVNTHGIKGELKVKASTDFIEERFQKGATLYLEYQQSGLLEFGWLFLSAGS